MSAAETAYRDQQIAKANEVLTRMVSDVRDLLDGGDSPEDVALAVAFAAAADDLDRVAVALGVALVRLARMPEGGDVR